MFSLCFHQVFSLEPIQYNTTMKINSIFSENVSGAFVTATMDTRKVRELMPVAIRVTYLRKVWYYQTGVSVKESDYNEIVKANRGKGENQKYKDMIKAVFDKVTTATRELTNANRFSIEVLKNEIGKRGAVSKSTLLDYWIELKNSKDKAKTREQYNCAAISFYKFMGAKTKRNPDTNRLELYGNGTDIKPNDLTPELIKDWERWMAQEVKDKDGKVTKIALSTASRSVYLRAFRAVCLDLQQNGIIRKAPEMTIKQGGRRSDDFLQVSDILKIFDYSGQSKEWADWWMILYLSNGSNLRDISELVWPHDSVSEFSFERSKMADKQPITVNIPILPELQILLDKYATIRQEGARVFPQILRDAKTETAITHRVHDFNADIRKGMQLVCSELGIKTATASTARNSYITTLTWHNTADAFIDAMVGHSDGKSVLRGYQGKASPKRRAAINSLLLTDPEED